MNRFELIIKRTSGTVKLKAPILREQPTTVQPYRKAAYIYEINSAIKSKQHVSNASGLNDMMANKHIGSLNKNTPPIAVDG